MGMGKKKSAPAPAKQEVAAPTVETKEYTDAQAVKNAGAQARVEDNASATLLQTKDEEELKRQGMAGVA